MYNEEVPALSRASYFLKPMIRLFFNIFIFVSMVSVLSAAETDTLRTVDLDEFVVSISRKVSKNNKLTQQVQLLSLSKIEFTNPPSTAELLSESGAVAVQKSQQGGGSPSLRGFEASRILLYIDNIPMNNLIYRAGHLQNMITVDPSLLSRVEVLYGPSSTAYGSDALGGVVHFHTRNPSLNQPIRAKAMTRYATVNNEKTIAADLNIGGKQWASFSAFSYSDFGDLRSGKQRNPFLPQGDNYIRRWWLPAIEKGPGAFVENDDPRLQIGSGYQQINLMQKFLFQPVAGVRHFLNLQFSTTSDIPRYDRLTDITNGKPKFAEWYYGPQERVLAAYQLDLTKRLWADKAGLTFAFQQVNESRHDRQLTSIMKDNRFEKVQVWNIAAFWNKDYERSSLAIGSDGALNFLKSSAYKTNLLNDIRSPLDTRYPGGRNYMHHFDGYANYSSELTSKLETSLGLRAGYSTLFSEFIDFSYFPFPENEVHQHHFTWSAAAGLDYTVSNVLSLAAHISTGYRVPNTDDLAKVFDSQPGLLVVPNPFIRPERTIGADVSLRYNTTGGFRLNHHFFINRLIDGIGLAPFQLNGLDSVLYAGTPSKVMANTNFNSGLITGFSTDMMYRWSLNWSADAVLTYTYGQVLSPQPMPLDHIAPMTGRLGLAFQSDTRSWAGSFFMLMNGAKRIERYHPDGEDNLHYATVAGVNGQGTPAWFTLNLRGEHRISESWIVQLGLLNFLDTEYRTFASGINAPGRNLTFTVIKKVN